MDRRWNRNTISLLSSVMTVIAFPFCCASSTVLYRAWKDVCVIRHCSWCSCSLPPPHFFVVDCSVMIWMCKNARHRLASQAKGLPLAKGIMIRSLAVMNQSKWLFDDRHLGTFFSSPENIVHFIVKLTSWCLGVLLWCATLYKPCGSRHRS